MLLVDHMPAAANSRQSGRRFPIQKASVDDEATYHDLLLNRVAGRPRDGINPNNMTSACARRLLLQIGGEVAFRLLV